MGLQKFRADIQGEAQKDGAIPFYARWMGGPSLALVRHCQTPFGPRTVYIRGSADTWFSIPAACAFRGRTITGYIISDDNGEYLFRAHSEHLPFAD